MKSLLSMAVWIISLGGVVAVAHANSPPAQAKLGACAASCGAAFSACVAASGEMQVSSPPVKRPRSGAERFTSPILNRAAQLMTDTPENLQVALGHRALWLDRVERGHRIFF